MATEGEEPATQVTDDEKQLPSDADAVTANPTADSSKFTIDDDSDDEMRQQFSIAVKYGTVESSSHVSDNHEDEQGATIIDNDENESSKTTQLQQSTPAAVSPSTAMPVSTKSVKEESTSPKLKSASAPSYQPEIESDWQPFSSDQSTLFPDQSTKHQPQPLSLQRSSSTADSLIILRQIFDTEYERAIEHAEISWKARHTSTRLSFLFSSLCMLLYLWGGCMFYRSEAGWSVPDALLFTVYTVTTVGYGGPRPLPNSAAFHAFTSVYVLVGISGVTVLGAHTYQLIMLEATRISSAKRRRSRREEEEEDGAGGEETTEEDPAMERFRRQFMSELEDRVRERPALDRALDETIKKFKEVKQYMETTRSGRILSVILPFVGMIMLGALVVGLIEGWTPLGE